LIAQDDTWIGSVDKGEAKWEKILSGGPQARIAATLTPLGSNDFLLQGGYDPTTKETFEAPWMLSRDLIFD
jgi:hypothetical protein